MADNKRCQEENPEHALLTEGTSPLRGQGFSCSLWLGAPRPVAPHSSPFPKLPIPSSPTFRLLPSHHTDTPLISVSTQTDYGILTSLPLNAAELRHQHNKWVTILAVIYLPMPQSQLRTHFHVEVILSLDLLPLRIS